MARFKLVHLTPNAREAFRLYRNVQRKLNGLSAELDTAQRWVNAIQHDIRQLEAGGHEVSDMMRARAARFVEVHQQVETRWQATMDRAQAAADVAVPLLKDEGYPFGWWHTGTMRIPDGVVSPGADRLTRRR